VNFAFILRAMHQRVNRFCPLAVIHLYICYFPNFTCVAHIKSGTEQLNYNHKILGKMCFFHKSGVYKFWYRTINFYHKRSRKKAFLANHYKWF
jgi:hypothetical protein